MFASEGDDSQHEDSHHDNSPSHSPPLEVTYNDTVHAPPHTSETTTPITIAPCPPHVSTQSQATITLSTPLFKASTTTTITQTSTTTTHISEPPVTVNISDTGAGASGFSTSHLSPPFSPLQ